MSKYAKVSIESVKKFKQAVKSASDFSPQFDKASGSLEELIKAISEMNTDLEKGISKMAESIKKLEELAKEIQEEIKRLESELSDLEAQRKRILSEMEQIQKTIAVSTEDGGTRMIPNPHYIVLAEELEQVNAQVAGVRAEISSRKIRLERVQSIERRLKEKTARFKTIISSLEGMKDKCKGNINLIYDLKKQNYEKANLVSDNLRKIEELIKRYLRQNMNYYPVVVSGLYELFSDKSRVESGYYSDEIEENTEESHEDDKLDESEEDNIYGLTEEEIKEHDVQFDDEGRITSFDGKSFGGQYNSYEVRLKQTPSPRNFVKGEFEGERGESKYIPSDRTAKGIIVIGILVKYGVDGIEYRNSEPDFEVCCEAIVKIDAMSGERYNYLDDDGIPRLGNFSQADIECAKKWNKEKRNGIYDWTARDVSDYRQANGLTWHEKCDTETMVLVKTDINDFFTHSGGCAECDKRDEVGGDYDE